MLQLFPAFLIQLLIQAVQQPGHSGGNQAILLQCCLLSVDSQVTGLKVRSLHRPVQFNPRKLAF